MTPLTPYRRSLRAALRFPGAQTFRLPEASWPASLARCIGLFLACLLLAPAARAGAFEDGLSAYESGNYEEAASRFAESLSQQESAAARHNLALSLFFLGQRGEATRELERAVRLAPFQEEYHYKLGALRGQLNLPDDGRDWAALGAQALTFPQWALLASLAFWLAAAAWLLPAIAHRHPNLAIKAVRWAALILLLPSLAALALHQRDRQLVIVVAEAPVALRAAPADAAPQTGTASPGERALIREQHRSFTRIETEREISGWVPSGSIESPYLPRP